MRRSFFHWGCILLCVLLFLTLAACGKEPAETQPATGPTVATDPTDSTEATDQTEPTETTAAIEPTEALTAPKIASTSGEGRHPVVDWYFDDATQLRYGNIPFNEICFEIDTEAALTGLANGTYDVVILPCASGETPSFGAYEVCPLFDDAIIFVHGNPCPTDASYDLALETIRSIYEEGGEFYWDTAQQEPLVPAYRFDNMSQELSFIFGIDSTADEILFDDEFNKFVWSNDGQHDSPLYPVYYSFSSGEASINGVVISVDGVFPTETTIADGTYPLGVSFYAVYPADDPDSASLAAELQIIAQQQP